LNYFRISEDDGRIAIDYEFAGAAWWTLSPCCSVWSP